MEEDIKRAMVAAVSAAIKYREENPSASEEEVIEHVLKVSNQIISRMGSD